MADPDRVFTASMSGLAQVADELRALSGKLRQRVLRNALAAGGRVFRDEARRLTPVLAVPVRRKGMLVRKPGTVRDAITVRTSKQARRRGDVGVFVNVRPARGLNKGARNPFDPFYWRWLEFGRRGLQAVGMLKRSLGRAPVAVTKIEAVLVPAIGRLNRPKAPAP